MGFKNSVQQTCDCTEFHLRKRHDFLSMSLLERMNVETSNNMQKPMKKNIKQHPLETLSGLYSPDFEKENCGFGMIANLDNKASHDILKTAIVSLCRMTHRGGLAADGRSGDGCGLLLSKPDQFFRKKAASLNMSLGDKYAVGMVFLNQQESLARVARLTLNKKLALRGLNVLGWHEVPIHPEVLGEQALNSLPRIEYVFINAAEDMDDDAFNRHLFVARRFSEMLLEDDPDFYVVSLHSKIIGYKGLMVPADLARFFDDLNQPDFAISVCSYHQRFSTNTLPQWRLAQPFRFLAHNGELNTIQGNRNWANARRKKMNSDILPEIEHINPLVSMRGSDSASLDNMLEVLMMGGSDVLRSIRLLIPPAWQNIEALGPEMRALFEFQSMHMEPWDGPAALVINNGDYAICALDRNGLRPTRYVITKDRNITFASEIGVFDYDPADVVFKGRIKAGQIVAVDLKRGVFLKPNEVNVLSSKGNPYQKWLNDHVIKITADHQNDAQYLQLSDDECHKAQKLFQVTFEERDQVIRILAEDAQEPTASMGDDAPLAVMSRQPRSIFDYFRQVFAQVTNPAIDPLRESIVMSLSTILGCELSIFHETRNHARRIVVDTPVLSPNSYHDMLKISNTQDSLSSVELSLHYDPDVGLSHAIGNLCDMAEAMVEKGHTILILSDESIQPDFLTIHACLATGAVHHRLISRGLRTDANLVISTATVRDSHHYAVLLGYGATAIYPWLAYRVIKDMHENRGLDSAIALGPYIENYIRGINKGLFKILSKMGISTIASYRGAQLFEAVGLSKEIIRMCFNGTPSRIKGSKFKHFHNDQQYLHDLAFNPRKTIAQGGLFKYIHGGEAHAFNPDVVENLRKAVQHNDVNAYHQFATFVNERNPLVLRDLLEIVPKEPVPIEEVESIENIIQRFDSAGISLGALSPEAHESLAIAMNRLGARSNSGEGGEDPLRYGTEKMSKIKQVASGRFGVTPHYLVNAEVIQIKVAQGAKPGEGGQLPGHKVDAYIAKLRHANEGVTLISPPPHHDIYSIEDLAQLIYDLKQVNPKALVSVKLVAAPGVGTIAAGVVKAYADLITIAGYDGGTGASPLTSVKYAGVPFELGLAETHKVLQANDLRGKVRVQTDGGLKTGLDVVKAAMLGAESFGFGTAPMIALGCKYLRICHLNTCAVGVATQNERLRKDHFIGLPEMVMHYFQFVAQEVREIMASIGVRSLNELIGQTQYLKQRAGTTEKQSNIDLSDLLHQNEQIKSKPNYCQSPANDPWDKGEKAQSMLAMVSEAIAHKKGGTYALEILNTDRSIGALVSGEIARKWGDKGMEDSPIRFNLTGVAGQSFGVWNAGGLHLYLKGDANDYVGKGMAGGRIVITPHLEGTFDPYLSPIVGNTCLYGATGGVLYALGTAGERFGVRNSGAIAVVEGLGDHGCEYMTGGEIVVLGATGLNFGAGMSGGIAYVYDKSQLFENRINPEMISLMNLDDRNYSERLRQHISAYHDETQSLKAKAILDHFEEELKHFWLVKPKNIELVQLWKMIQAKVA